MLPDNKIDIIIKLFLVINIRYRTVLTLIGTHGYSGNAAATAFAPPSFVKLEIPTKNSLPDGQSDRDQWI